MLFSLCVVVCCCLLSFVNVRCCMLLFVWGMRFVGYWCLCFVVVRRWSLRFVCFGLFVVVVCVLLRVGVRVVVRFVLLVFVCGLFISVCGFSFIVVRCWPFVDCWLSVV